MGNKGRQGGQSQGGGRGVAHAPYNFVPLPDKVVPAEPLPDHDRYHADQHSGHFTVTLTTETPLYIRGMLTEAEAAKAEQHKNKSDFFQRNGKPVIPGSSLRGMLRSLVEIVAFGKMGRVSDKPKIFFRAVAARSDDPLGENYKNTLGPLGRYVEAGFLECDGDKWFIRPAAKQQGKTFAKVRDLDERGNVAEAVSRLQGIIHLNSADYRVQYLDVMLAESLQSGRAGLRASVRTPRQGEQRDGVLVCTGNMAESSGESRGRVQTGRKNFVIVFEADARLPRVQIDPQAVKDYRDGLTPFLKEKPFDEEFGCLVAGRPIFYIPPRSGEGEMVIYFGHAPFFRIPATLTETKGGKRTIRAVTPRDFIPEALRERSDHYDIAEAIFGYIGKAEEAKDIKQGDKRRAYASRVSVSDAVVADDSKDFYEREFIPKILGGPKVTTFQHYLEQPEEAYRSKAELHHYATTKPRRPNLRGHKLYWRQHGTTINDVEQKDLEALKKIQQGSDTQHTRMKPVKENVTFKFTVRFENLSAVELGALAWALYLPCSAEHRHQLGMGKPYGMGMVKLTPTLHLIDRQKRYVQLFEGDGWATAERRETADEYIKAFEEYVVSQLGIKHDFRAIDRIRELCVMLTPQERRFEYMKIEKPDNEYTDRPVLPRPSEVKDV
ncbi:MAG: TIGR03986 family CRISPR-associated RAMP protein [Chloroflexi bacterium CFX4]|nr:TIGR03986 family CRISPR-associated RAMP protein [Chloroflexi bacterium CFX4]MDL1924122.1 TIGR03986 family CRISPR-associated RAMP protein [Chloroflexi bacterium CFX3]